MIAISFMIWSYRYFIPTEHLIVVSFFSLFLLSVPFFLISFFYKNTIYTLPIIFGMVFSLGIQNINLDTFDLAFIGFFKYWFNHYRYDCSCD